MAQNTADYSTGELAAVFERYGDHESTGELAYLMAKASHQAGKVAQARELLESCLRRSRAGTAVSPRLRTRLQLELATLTAHADNEFPRACELLDDLLDEPDLGDLAGAVLIERGYCLLHTSELEKAEKDIRRGLGSVRDQNQRTNIAKGLQYLGMVQLKQSDPVALESACHHLLEAARITKDMPGLFSQIADSLGRAFSRRGKYDMAARWFAGSIRKKQQLGDQMGMAASYGGLGEAHLRAGQYQQAARAYAEDLQMVREFPSANFVRVGQLLCLLSECHRRQKKWQRAREILAEAEQILPNINETQRPVSEGYIGTYKARVHADEGQYREALQIFAEAEQKFIEAKYKAFLPAVRQGIGEVQIQLGDLDAAERALLWAESHESDPYEKRFIYKNLTLLARRRNNQGQVVRYAAQLFFLNEQLAESPATAIEPARPPIPTPAKALAPAPALEEAEQPEIEIVGRIPPSVFAGKTVTVRFQARHPSGAPVPDLELLLESESLKRQGGTLNPPGNLKTNSNGSASFEIHLGEKEDSVVVEIRATAFPVKTEVAFRVYDVEVESEPGSPVPERIIPLLRQMFFSLAREVKVEKITQRSQDVAFLEVKCNLSSGMPGRRRTQLLVKTAPEDDIISERDAHNDNMEWIEEAKLPVVLTTAIHDSLGAIAYQLPGAGTTGDILPLDQDLQDRTFNEINTAIETLFADNLSCLYREPRFSSDALAMSYSLPEDFADDTFWLRVADRLPPNTIRHDSEGRVVIEFPDRIHVPGLFSTHRKFMAGESRAQKTYVHGGVTTENLCVDKEGRPWLTDWSNFGEGHLFYDFVTLEVDVRLKALQDKSVALKFEEWYRIESQISEAYRLGLSGHRASVSSLTRTLDSLILKKAYAAVIHTRQMATKYLDPADTMEYMRGLFCFAVRRLAEAQGQQEIYMLLSLGMTLSLTMQREELKFDDLRRLKPEAVTELLEMLGIDEPARLNPARLDARPRRPADKPAAREPSTADKAEERQRKSKERDENQFMRALQGADRALFDKLLANVSVRRRQMLFEDLEFRRSEPDSIEQAQREVLNVLKRMDARGMDLFEEEDRERAS